MQRQYERRKRLQRPRGHCRSTEVLMVQEAEGIRAKGEAEAMAIRAKALAEAEGMEKRPRPTRSTTRPPWLK